MQTSNSNSNHSQRRASLAPLEQVSHKASVVNLSESTQRRQSINSSQTAQLRRPSIFEGTQMPTHAGRRSSIQQDTSQLQRHQNQQIPQYQPAPTITVTAGPRHKASLANIIPSLANIMQSSQALSGSPSPTGAGLTANVEAPIAVLSPIESTDESDSAVARQAAQRKISLAVIIPEEDEEADPEEEDKKHITLSARPSVGEGGNVTARSSVMRRGSVLSQTSNDAASTISQESPSMLNVAPQQSSPDQLQSNSHHSKDKVKKAVSSYAHAAPCVERSVPVGTYDPYPMIWVTGATKGSQWSKDTSDRFKYMSTSANAFTSQLNHLGPGCYLQLNPVNPPKQCAKPFGSALERFSKHSQLEKEGASDAMALLLPYLMLSASQNKSIPKAKEVPWVCTLQQILSRSVEVVEPSRDIPPSSILTSKIQYEAKSTAVDHRQRLRKLSLGNTNKSGMGPTPNVNDHQLPARNTTSATNNRLHHFAPCFFADNVTSKAGQC